jgi:arsenate reductase
MKPNVLFLCTHNSCRSQIAEAIGKEMAKDVFNSYSAGTALKKQINQDAQRIMKDKYNIDMESNGQHNKLIDAVPQCQIVITMGCGVECPLYLCDFKQDWGLDDPTGKDEKVFNDTALMIDHKANNLKQRIIKKKMIL